MQLRPKGRLKKEAFKDAFEKVHSGWMARGAASASVSASELENAEDELLRFLA